MESKRRRLETFSEKIKCFERKISLVSNYFTLITLKCDIFCYDISVKIKRRKESKFVENEILIEKKQKKSGNQMNQRIFQKLIDDNCSPGKLFYDQEKLKT